MAITEALRLLITADTAGAVTSIQNVGRAADRELGRTDKSLDRIGLNLSRFGAGMLGAGALAVAGLGKAAQAAGNLEQAVGGTEAVFGDASGAIDKYASNAAQKLGLSERAFRELTTVAGAQLKNLGFSVEEASEQSIKLTEIGADLAATFGGTTQQAVEALGAAFRGEADPAEQFGLRLNQTAVNAKAVELGLAQSTSSVDGHAKAQATLALIMEQSADAQGQFARESDTLAGRQQRLSAEFENLQAAIGEGALPVFETMIDVASGAVGVFDGLNDASGGLVGQLAAFGSLGLIVAGGLSFIVGQAIQARDNLKALGAAASSFTTKIGGIGRAAALAAGAAGLAGLAFAAKQVADAAAEADLDAFVQDLNSTTAAAQAAAEETIIVQDAMGLLEGSFENVLDKSVPAAESFLKTAESLGVAKDELARMRQALEEKKAADIGGAAAQNEYSDAVDEGAEAMEGQASATEEAANRLQEYSDKLKGLTDPIFAAQDALAGVTEAQLAFRDAEAEVVTATGALNEALASGDQAAIAEATRGLEDATRNLEDAEWGTTEAARNADSALAALQDAVDRGDVSVDAFTSTLQTWVAQGFITQAQADNAAASVGALAGAADNADSKRVDIPVAVTGVEQSINDIARIQERINALHGRDVGIRIVGTAVGAVGGGVLRFHEGGVVPGRRGEEVAAILQAGETVLPLDSGLHMAAAMGGGGPTIVVNIDRPIVANANQFEQMVTYAVSKATRTGGLNLAVNGERVRVA